MPSVSTSTKIYQDFKDIEEGAYHTIVRFYEAKTTKIAQLKFENHFEILVAYVNALFEIGAYAKHLEEVEQVILLSITDNIQFHKGEDIYFKSLFQKAASYFNLLEYEKSEHILKELIKIAPFNTLPIRFLKKCKTSLRPNYIKTGRALSIALFFIAAITAVVEVIIVHPFIPEKTSIFEYLWIGILGLGLLILVSTFLYHRFTVNIEVASFVRQIRAKK